MRKAQDSVGMCIVLYNRSLLAQAQEDHDLVADLFGEVLTLSSGIGDLANIAYCMEGLAAVAMARGQAERAAILLGAANGLLRIVGAAVYTYRPDRSLYDRTLFTARATLGDHAWGAAWEQGFAMSATQAVAYALSDDT
jgi:hypothetical protein